MVSKTKILTKVSDILHCFTPADPTWTATLLSKKLNIPVTTLHGILTDLVVLDFLEQCPFSKEYKVGLRHMEMGVLHANNFELNNIAHGMMRELTFKVNQLVGLSVLYKGWMYISMTIMPLESTRAFRYVGPKMPMHQTSGGKAILAHLPPDKLQRCYAMIEKNCSPSTECKWDKLEKQLELVRSSGYSLAWGPDNKELPYSVGAPIFGRNRQVLAGLVVIGPYKGFTDEELSAISSNVIFAANEISMRSGHLSASMRV